MVSDTADASDTSDTNDSDDKKQLNCVEKVDVGTRLSSALFHGRLRLGQRESQFGNSRLGWADQRPHHVGVIDFCNPCRPVDWRDCLTVADINELNWGRHALFRAGGLHCFAVRAARDGCSA